MFRAEARPAVEGCSLAIFQSFQDSYNAFEEWEESQCADRVCRLRRGAPFPDRRVYESAEYVDSSDYWYLQEDFRPMSGWTVVFRGVAPGVYGSWCVSFILFAAWYLKRIVFRLEAGPLVVGIDGALWRGFAIERVAELAFQHACEDGVVQEFTLVVPDLEEAFVMV